MTTELIKESGPIAAAMFFLVVMLVTAWKMVGKPLMTEVKGIAETHQETALTLKDASTFAATAADKCERATERSERSAEITLRTAELLDKRFARLESNLETRKQG